MCICACGSNYQSIRSFFITIISQTVMENLLSDEPFSRLKVFTRLRYFCDHSKLFSTFTEYSQYFMKNPTEWKEKNFLLWLEKNGDLFVGNRTYQERQRKWHNCFLNSPKTVISHCQCFLDHCTSSQGRLRFAILCYICDKKSGFSIEIW